MFHFHRKRTTKEIIMSIEAQVASLVEGQAALTTAVQSLTTAVAAIAAPTVDLTPVTTALAALDTKVSTILADITDPDDAAAGAGGQAA